MNPILDIFATAQTNVPPTPVGTTTSGQPQGDGLFAQLFADAIATTPQQGLFPIAGLPVKGLMCPESAISENELAGHPILTQEDQVISQVIKQGLTADQTQTPRGEAALVIPQAQIGSAVIDNVDPAAITEVIVNRPPDMESRVGLIAADMPQDQETALLSRVEAELSTLTGQKANGALINAQVEISDDAAKALADVETEVVAKGTSKPNSEDLVQSQKSSAKATASASNSLKGNLRRAFPSLNIESASGKVDVQVRLTNSSNETQVRAENPSTIQSVATSTNGLPIAIAPQVTAAVLTCGPATKSARVTRQSQATDKTQVSSATKSLVESEVPVRIGPRVAMRKPVQIALKSQGFDIEKLMSSEGSAKDPLAENMAIDKADFKVAADKQIQQATDRSLELSGTERFKLDIKRGHIEALLKKGEIKLQLQPEHLGNLKIRLTTTPTEVNARMETSSEDAKRAVELSLPQLRESFERAGLKLNSIEVSVNDDSDARRQHAFHQEWRGRNGGVHSTSDKYSADVPATTEISQNLNIAYGGALNLVA